MCDDNTLRADEAALAQKGLTRRSFAALGAGAGAAAVVAGCAPANSGTDGGVELLEEIVRITTDDGIADGFFVHPAKGRHPAIVMWPDIAGLREVKKIMARRLAEAGYAVLVVNQYYRSQPAPVMESFSEYMEEEGRNRVAAYRELLTPDAVMRDAKAYVAFLDSKPEVDKARGIGSHGYCMGGPFAVRTAAAVPGRVRAAASLHGGGLVNEEPDSPHRLLEKTDASFLFAVARNDDAKAPEDKSVLRKAADQAQRAAQIDVYDADHGWCVADLPAYDPAEAERAWQRMLALYESL